MIDFSEWIAATGSCSTSPLVSGFIGFFKWVFLVALLIAIVGCGAAFFRGIDDPMRAAQLFAWTTYISLGVLFVVGIAGGVYCLLQYPPAPSPDECTTFTQEVERRFDVRSFKIDDHGGLIMEDAKYSLPSDRSEATWVSNGRLVEGTVVVDGTQVGLFDEDGNSFLPTNGS